MCSPCMMILDDLMLPHDDLMPNFLHSATLIPAKMLLSQQWLQ